MMAAESMLLKRPILRITALHISKFSSFYVLAFSCLSWSIYSDLYHNCIKPSTLYCYDAIRF